MSASDRFPCEAFADYADLPRWVCWRPETRNGKPTKVPVTWTGKAAKSTDPATWNVCAACAKGVANRGFAGTGIVLGDLGDGRHLVGVDLDGCRDPDTGAIDPWAQAVLDDFKSYAEVSPSGTGIKIFAIVTDPVAGRVAARPSPGHADHRSSCAASTVRCQGPRPRRVGFARSSGPAAPPRRETPG